MNNNFQCLYDEIHFYHNAEPNTAPINFNITAKNSTGIKLSWMQPVQPNGIIRYYLLLCTGREQSLNHTVNSSQTTTTLIRLLPYTNYSCSITAHTSVGGGPAATISVVTEQDSELFFSMQQP